MRIPVSNNFGVAPTISPGADFKAPQASTVAADQLQQAGKAVQQGADAYARIQNNMLQDANRLRLDAAGTEAQRVMLARMNEVKALKGESAIYRGDKSLDDEYDEMLTKDFDAIGAKLGNDVQRQAWALEAGAMRRQFRSQVSSHIAAEYQNYDKQVQAGIIETSYQLMSQNIDRPDEITRGRDAIVGAVARLNKGAPPKFVTAETIKALTPAHASIVQSLLAGGAAQQARDYFARPDVQAEMLPAVRARLSESLAVASADIAAEQAVQEVIGGMGDGWTRAEADKQLSSRFASDPSTLKTARNLLNYQDGLRDDARKEYTRRLTEPVERLLGDADRSGGLISTSAPELVALRGRDAEAYRTYSDRVAAHNEQVRSNRRAAEERVRSLAIKSEEENAAAIKWDMVLNPDKYRNADMRAQLASLAGSKAIKPAGASELLKLWQDIQDPSKGGNLKTMSTLAEYMDARLQGVMTGSPSDLKPFSGLGKPAQDAIRAKARAAIDRVMIDRQMSGQTISDKDAREIIDSMFVNTSIRSSFLGFSGASVPVTKLDMTIGIPQAAIDLLKSNNTPQTRLEFDQKYGVGMAAAVTGK